MSKNYWICFLCTTLAVSLALVGPDDTANAQIVRGRLGGGVVISAPYVNLRVGPVGIPVRPYVLPRRRIVQPPAAAVQGAPYGAPAAAQPRYYGGQAQYGGTPTPAAQYQAGAGPVRSEADQDSYPSADELRQMDDGSLLNTLLDLTMRLDERLGRFNTGAGWQRLLRLPDDALPPPSPDGRVTLGMKSLSATLAQFDTIAGDPQYDVISRLPVYIATRAALQETVSRFGGQAPTDDSAPLGIGTSADRSQGGPRLPSAETLPPPEPSPSATRTRSIQEGRPRSILKR